MKKYIYIILGLLFTNIYALDQNYLIVSPPKSGGHLAADLLYLLINKMGVFDMTCTEIDKTSINTNSFKIHKSCFRSTNLFYSKENKQYLKEHNYKIIFIIRDPRDVATSFARLIKSSNTWQKIKYYSMPLEKIISNIACDFKIDAPGWKNDNINNMRFGSDFYNQYLGWMYDEEVCTIKYEDLIGPICKGSEQKQIATILKVADYLGVVIDENRAKDISKKIIKSEFSNNKIGFWKKHFTQNNIHDYKKIMGNMLIDMGYEKDLNW